MNGDPTTSPNPETLFIFTIFEKKIILLNKVSKKNLKKLITLKDNFFYKKQFFTTFFGRKKNCSLKSNCLLKCFANLFFFKKKNKKEVQRRKFKQIIINKHVHEMEVIREIHC